MRTYIVCNEVTFCLKEVVSFLASIQYQVSAGKKYKTNYQNYLGCSGFTWVTGYNKETPATVQFHVFQLLNQIHRLRFQGNTKGDSILSSLYY
jgi:hypothetical protein